MKTAAQMEGRAEITGLLVAVIGFLSLLMLAVSLWPDPSFSAIVVFGVLLDAALIVSGIGTFRGNTNAYFGAIFALVMLLALDFLSFNLFGFAVHGLLLSWLVKGLIASA